jgi:hypothetical protein
MTHECRRSMTCNCYLDALEPRETCPVHGVPWPPRCEICGKFMQIITPQYPEEVLMDSLDRVVALNSPPLPKQQED